VKQEQLNKGAKKNYPLKKGQHHEKQVKIAKYYDLAGLAVISILGIIIYSNSFTCSFHFDDIPRIVDNTNIRNLADVKTWWNYYPTRPVGIFTFVLNYHFNQLDVRYWHLVNLVIHLINSGLVWWLALLILSTPSMKDNPMNRHKNAIAFFTALLFVSHPLATQSVTYIVQRFASLVTMFYLLSATLYMKARLTDKMTSAAWLMYTGSLISALLAMLTKENAFTLPPALLLFELFFFRIKKLSINFRDYRVLLFIAAFLSVIIFLAFQFSSAILNSIPPSNGNNYTITPINYLFTQFSVILKYIQLLFLPVNQNLDYDFPISESFFTPRTLLSFLVLLMILVLAAFLYKRHRILSFGIFWFFLTLSVESSFIPIKDLIFEHRTYLPSVGFFLALCSGIYILLWNKYKNLAISILLMIVASNTILAYERNKVWKDDLTLWDDNVSKSPNKAGPVLNRGVAYGKLKQWDKSTADYLRAIEINPNYSTAYSNLGINWGNLEQWDKSIEACSRAIELEPKYIEAYYNRGFAYSNLGIRDKAISDYTKAIGIDPKYAIAYYNRGIDWFNLGKWEKSIADFSKVVEIDPSFSAAWYNRGIDWGNLEQWDKAIHDYSMAIGLNPKFVLAYNGRGIAYHNLRQWEKAISDFSSAVAIDPSFTRAYSNRDISYSKLHGEK
jgi:protein O-mannosyl-transferase